MRYLMSITVAVFLALTSSAVSGQDYWEYDAWESEWERHSPTEGLEYEYEDDVLDEVEREQYEYEPGEGYHEQEWYDPSDWFEIGSDVDYENDDYDAYDYDFDGGYYDDGFYDDDWYYDYYD